MIEWLADNDWRKVAGPFRLTLFKWSIFCRIMQLGNWPAGPRWSAQTPETSDGAPGPWLSCPQWPGCWWSLCDPAIISAIFLWTHKYFLQLNTNILWLTPHNKQLSRGGHPTHRIFLKIWTQWAPGNMPFVNKFLTVYVWNITSHGAVRDWTHCFISGKNINLSITLV